MQGMPIITTTHRCVVQLTKKGLQIEKLDTNLIKQLIEVILTPMESFPNNKLIFNNTLIIISNEYLLQNASFDRYKCIQLLLNHLVNSNDMNINENAVNICVKLIEEISVKEKSTLSSNPIYNKTLLKIVESCLHSDTNHDILIQKTLRFVKLS
jgi:hypothetical protein